MPWQPLPHVTESQSRDFGRFKKKARFLVDENVHEAVVLVLRQEKWNVEYVPDSGLGGHADEDVFAYAWREDRVLLTHDRDFLDDRRFPPHRNPGIVVLPGASGTAEGIGAALRDVLSVIGKNRKAFRRFKIEIAQDGIWNIKHMTRVSDEVRNWRIRFDKNGETYEWEE